MKRNTIVIAVLFIATAVAIRFGLLNTPSTETVQDSYSYGTEDTNTSNQMNMDEQNVLGQQEYTEIPDPVLDAEKEYSVTLKTNKGDITIQLFQKEVPVAANNFAALVKDGFYNGLSFHRVIEGFMIQGGDPSGDGTGGPGYSFNDEPITRDYKRGTIAYANSGANTNGSQFFIMHQDYPLPKKYVIFGEVISGIEVVDALATTPTRMSDYGEPSVPTEDLKIETATLQEM